MRATRVEREVFRGDTLYFRSQVFQDSMTGELFTVPVTNPLTPPPPAAVPFGLSGCALEFTAKYQYPDADSQAVWSLNTNLGGGITIVTSASGVYAVYGPPLQTVGFPDSPVDLRIDTQLIDANGNPYTIEYGTLIVRPDVTRTTTTPAVNPVSPPTFTTHVSSYQLLTGDVGADFNTASGPLTCTMPASPQAGRPYYVSLSPTGTNPLTIAVPNGYTIEGQSTWSLTAPGESVTLILVGMDYRVF
jgi:hypothetical protein